MQQTRRLGVCNPLGGDWISFTIGKKSVGQQARVGEEHRHEDWVCSQMQVCIEWDLEGGLGGNSSEEIYHTTFGRELPLMPEEWPLFKVTSGDIQMERKGTLVLKTKPRR